MERPDLLHSLQHRFPGGSGPQLEYFQQGGRIAADGRPVLNQQVEEIELLRLGKFAGLRDTGSELLPWQHVLDGREGVFPLRLRFDEGPANFSIKQKLIIDLPAGLLKALLVLVPGGVEQPADDAVMKVNDLVNNRRCALEGS